jgi:hypothetical protein
MVALPPPDGAAAIVVVPGGSVSVTVIAPLVGSVPTFLTTTIYASLAPSDGLKLVGCPNDLIDHAGSGTAAVAGAAAAPLAPAASMLIAANERRYLYMVTCLPC